MRLRETAEACVVLAIATACVLVFGPALVMTAVISFFVGAFTIILLTQKQDADRLRATIRHAEELRGEWEKTTDADGVTHWQRRRG